MNRRTTKGPSPVLALSALFERPSEPCGAALVLWVATGRRFEGRPHPDLVRVVSGRIHLLLSHNPGPSPGDALPILREAAERALRRIDE